MSRIAPLTALVLFVACTQASRSARTPFSVTSAASPDTAASATIAADGCDSGCATVPMPAEVAAAIVQRVDSLRARGGDCERIAAVIDRSRREERIRVRPYMWHVGEHLTSGEAKPTGEMTLALAIDPLNQGVRGLDDLLATMVHEAAHIAFAISATNGGEQRVDGYVQRCS